MVCAAEFQATSPTRSPSKSSRISEKVVRTEESILTIDVDTSRHRTMSRLARASERSVTRTGRPAMAAALTSPETSMTARSACSQRCARMRRRTTGSWNRLAELARRRGSSTVCSVPFPLQGSRNRLGVVVAEAPLERRSMMRTAMIAATAMTMRTMNNQSITIE